MLLSIIIPVYNMADCIACALQSARLCDAAQDCEYEVIAVNDGSADGSIDVITAAANAHAGLRVFDTAHAGVSHARNTGLQHARGRYVTFLDADDALCGKGLESLLALIRDNAHDDLIVMNMRTDGHSRPDYDWTRYFSADTAYHGSDLMHTPYYRHSACGIAYRREFIGDTLFDESLKVSEDAIWVSRLLARNPQVRFVDADLYNRHPRQGSTSRTFDDNRLACDWAAIERCSQLCAESATSLARHVHSRLLYDLAHNMLLHALRSQVGIGAVLGAYPIKHILRKAPAPSTRKHSLLRLSPLLYGHLLQTKHLICTRKKIATGISPDGNI